jgi:hypothetical protein
LSHTHVFWISLDILAWETFSEAGDLCEDRQSLLRRPYELLHHAEDKLSRSPTELDLVDVITTLKRAAFHRKDSLEGLYELKRLPISGLPKDQLERLAFLGIIKPMVFRNLVDIRNCVEHQDAKPPGLARCKELAEYIWYFLRSTDRLLKETTSHYVLGDTDSEDPKSYWIEMGNGPSKDWLVTVRGWLPSSLFAVSSRDRCCTIEGTFEHAKELRRPGDKNRAPDDVFVDGRVRGPRDGLISIYQQYFSEV